MKNITIRSLSRLSIGLFVFLIIVLPSGNIGSVNFKIASMCLLLATISMFIGTKKKISVKSIKLLFIFLTSFIFVIISHYNSTHLAISKGYSNTEATLFVTYFISTITLLISVKEKIVSEKELVKTILKSCSIYCILKIVITIASIIGVLSIYTVSDLIQSIFSVKPMLFPITDKLSRLQLANDYIICFSLFFIISRSNFFDFISKSKLYFYIILMTLSTLISFSRYMILVLILSLMINLFMSRKLNFKKISIAFFSMILIVIAYSFSYEAVNTAINLRFNSDANDVSDDIRQFQVSCLTQAFDDKPLLGHGGLGDYSIRCPGPGKAEFSYEVQYLGFLYRFGLLQTALVVLMCFLQFKIGSSGSILKSRNIISTIAFLSWMMVGFFNPYLISGYASIIIVLCSCLTAKENK
ncbi:TPA: O-antigen ligase family protein [Klebsiella pneumoniae]|nr:O-antigen ligase family protein [Klebsiella pneumoniae]